jgi:hypothetical protein
MTLHLRTLVFALCCLLVWGTSAWAAGKQKSHGRGKSSVPSHEKTRDPSSTGGAVDAAPAKSSPGPAQARPVENRPPLRESVRQESRIEFDERMLRGQSAAGVIYLFQRTPSDWKSIVEVPGSFRARTVNVLAPTEEKK